MWLEYTDSVVWSDAAENRLSPDPPADRTSNLLEARYQKIRRRWRLVIHTLLAVCGGLMIAAGWAGPGRFWIAAWTAVALLMVCILLLAIGDAIRTYYHRTRKLLESRRRKSDSAGG